MSHSLKTLQAETIAGDIARRMFVLQTARADNNSKVWKYTYEKINKLYDDLGKVITSIHYTDEK